MLVLENVFAIYEYYFFANKGPNKVYETKHCNATFIPRLIRKHFWRTIGLLIASRIQLQSGSYFIMMRLELRICDLWVT